MNVDFLIISAKRILSSLFLAWMALLSPVMAEESPTLDLGYGMWEGISDGPGAGYYLLYLAENGEHRLLVGNMASAFRRSKNLPFTNQDIVCSKSECSLSIVNTYEPGSSIRLIMSPYLDDSFNVLDIRLDSNGSPIYNQTYQLDKQKGRSTVSAFIKRYRDRVTSLPESRSDGIYGLWLGVVDMRSSKQLVVLNVRNDETSEFVLFINGGTLTNETYFSASEMLSTEDGIRISTSHVTFANQLLVHKLNDSMLSGHFYSYHKGQPIEPSGFSLFKIK